MLAEAAARADELAKQGNERELADLRREWADELEVAARSADYRERAGAYRAIGQFRFRQKADLLRRGLEDESPACRGSALLSLELLSRDAPREINAVRPLLHTLERGRQPRSSPSRRPLAAQRLAAARHRRPASGDRAGGRSRARPARDRRQSCRRAREEGEGSLAIQRQAHILPRSSRPHDGQICRR